MSNIAKVEDARWLDHLPDDWKIQKVKQVYNLQVGFTPDTKKDVYYDDENGFEWLTITDLTTDRIIPKSTEKHISKKYVDEYTPKIIPAGSLLYSFKLSLGQVAFTDREIYSNEAIASFLADKDVCLPYLYYSSCFIELNANENIYGAKLLNQQLIKNAYIPVPPLSDQKAIANFLDEKCSNIDNAIEKQKAVVEKLKEYRQSVITEAVIKGLDKDVEMKETGLQWIEKISTEAEIIKLRLFSYLKGRIGWQGLNSNDFIDEGPFCITGTDFINGKVNWDTCYHVSEERYQMDEKIQVKNGDLLITKDGTIGKLAIIDNMPDKACLNSHLLIIRPLKNKYINSYLYYVMSSDIFKKYIELASRGSIMDSLSQEMTGEFKFPIYRLEKQQQIVDYLDNKCSKIDEAIARSNGIIEKLEEYKKSLIYEYVTGKKEVPSKYYEVQS